jgi:DNA polymerase (family 10)
MTNKEISRALKLTAALGELHDENPFKLKSLTNAAFQIDRSDVVLEGKSLEELLQIPGIGKGIALKILELEQTGSTEELTHYVSITPHGIIELLNVKGIGPKKVAQLWRELEIETAGELLYACNENRLVELKGFGAKTQASILQALEYRLANQGKLHFAEAEMVAHEAIQVIQKAGFELQIGATGSIRRKMETVDDIEILVQNDEDQFFALLRTLSQFSEIVDNETFFTAKFLEKYNIHFIPSYDFEKDLLYTTGPAEHLLQLDFDLEEPINSETTFYEERGFPFILPELRDLDIDQASKIDTQQLVTWADIKGSLHNHSTWSDGANTIEEMALACKKLKLDYLGICDHSKSAGYAGGLSIERVLQQHQEIAQLNAKIPDFTIFKGIESDILVDGSLDYPEEILKTFDFIVASVHSVLKMDESRATQRLIKAIENPYTRILGHPTGRLLLSRKGYPIDHHKVIDACVANNVVIELNAHPYRLDIDWRFIPYCMQKNVLISINPDAHKKSGFLDMHYGINVARKGGLTKDFMLNGKTTEEFKVWVSIK